MTYDQRTKDLVQASCSLDQAGRTLELARMAIRGAGFEEDSQALWEMTIKLSEIFRKVTDTLGNYAVGELEKEEEDE